VFGQVIVRGQQEAASTAGRIADCPVWLRRHDIDESSYERTRREVLAGAAFDVLGVLCRRPS